MIAYSDSGGDTDIDTVWSIADYKDQINETLKRVKRIGVDKMGLFTEDTKIKPIPRTEGSKEGEAYLQQLIGQSINAPLQGTAGLTPVQMAIQQTLPLLLSRINQSGELATDEYKKTLSGDYDPRTSPYYEGLRQEADRLKTAGTTQLRQRAELGGMLQSTPAIAQEANFVNQADSLLLKELGRLTESERGRKMLAAEGVQGAESRNLANVAAVGGIAEAARSIEQQQADALYNQALMAILAPYQYQANIANSLMNYKQDYYVAGGGLSDLGFLAQTGAQVGGMALGGYMGGLAGAAGGAAGGAGGAIDQTKQFVAQNQGFPMM
jgi:hypothetical protein